MKTKARFICLISDMFTDNLFHPDHVVPAPELEGAFMEFSDEAEPDMPVELLTVI